MTLNKGKHMSIYKKGYFWWIIITNSAEKKSYWLIVHIWQPLRDRFSVSILFSLNHEWRFEDLLRKWPESSGQKNSNKDSTILNLQSIHGIFWISIYINIIYRLFLNLFLGRTHIGTNFCNNWNFYAYPIGTSIFHGSVDFDGWYICHTKLYFSEIPWFY